MPRGNPDGGQWTRVGGSGGRLRIAQNIPPEEERDFEDANLASEAEFEAIDVERQELLRRVREIDPMWAPHRVLSIPITLKGELQRQEGRETRQRLGSRSLLKNLLKI